MANYQSIQTGSVIDNVISNALLKSEATSIYLTKSNASSLYPTKTGGGASGTWPINISGNAVNDSDGHPISTTYLKLSGGTTTQKIKTDRNGYVPCCKEANGTTITDLINEVRYS